MKVCKTLMVLSMALLLVGCQQKEKIQETTEAVVEIETTEETEAEIVIEIDKITIDSLYPDLSINGKHLKIGESTIDDVKNLFGEPNNTYDYGTAVCYIYRDETHDNMQNIMFTMFKNDTDKNGKISEILLNYPEDDKPAKYSIDGLALGYTLNDMNKAFGVGSKFESNAEYEYDAYEWVNKDHVITAQIDSENKVVCLQVRYKEIVEDVNIDAFVEALNESLAAEEPDVNERLEDAATSLIDDVLTESTEETIEETVEGTTEGTTEGFEESTWESIEKIPEDERTIYNYGPGFVESTAEETEETEAVGPGVSN